MSTIINTHKFTAAAAFGAVALFSMLSFGNNAEAARVSSCEGPTASSVKSCCEQLVKENGRPYWMIQAGMTCKKSTSCHGVTFGLVLLAVTKVTVPGPPTLDH